jgi:undecaprenyl-diphosphatase
LAVLEARPGGLAERLAARLAGRPAALAFLFVMAAGYLTLAAVSVAIGWMVIHLLLHLAWVNSADENVVVWFVHHRSPTGTDASVVGSTVAGGLVLPILVATVAVVCVAMRQWRIAAFVAIALILESAVYRTVTLLIHRQRPTVHRLEDLPANASYPSGHTAASIAVYAGLVLLLTSRIRDRTVRIVAWTLAILMPIFVAGSRMYRGMHHPIDTLAGVTIGVSALAIAVFACRVAGAVAATRS